MLTEQEKRDIRERVRAAKAALRFYAHSTGWAGLHGVQVDERDRSETPIGYYQENQK